MKEEESDKIQQITIKVQTNKEQTFKKAILVGNKAQKIRRNNLSMNNRKFSQSCI